MYRANVGIEPTSASASRLFATGRLWRSDPPQPSSVAGETAIHPRRVTIGRPADLHDRPMVAPTGSRRSHDRAAETLGAPASRPAGALPWRGGRRSAQVRTSWAACARPSDPLDVAAAAGRVMTRARQLAARSGPENDEVIGVLVVDPISARRAHLRRTIDAEPGLRSSARRAIRSNSSPRRWRRDPT